SRAGRRPLPSPRHLPQRLRRTAQLLGRAAAFARFLPQRCGELVDLPLRPGQVAARERIACLLQKASALALARRGLMFSSLLQLRRRLLQALRRRRTAQLLGGVGERLLELVRAQQRLFLGRPPALLVAPQRAQVARDAAQDLVARRVAALLSFDLPSRFLVLAARVRHRRALGALAGGVEERQ